MNNQSQTRKQLDEAFRLCGCKGDLDTASCFPPLPLLSKTSQKRLKQEGFVNIKELISNALQLAILTIKPIHT